MSQFHYLIIGFFLYFFLFSCAEQPNPNEKYRVVILTDMTHDDGNSLIRYLYYASYFDLEALIVTNQLPDYDFNDTGPWNKAMRILDAYNAELLQLRKHDPGLPSYEDLLSVTKPGRGALPIIWLTNTLNFSGRIADRYVESRWDSTYFHDWIGEGHTPHGEPKDSPGSEWLVEVFAKDDDRPIFVQAWGGTITFVQALYRFRQRFGEERFQALLPKLHLFGILFQDISFEYFADFIRMQERTCAGFGTAIPTYGKDPVELGMVMFDAGHFWQYVWSSDPGWTKPMTAADANGHGPLSGIYDDGGEGDTPSFLYLLSGVFGLNDPFNPMHGSWGGLFKPMGEGFPASYYHSCGVDVKELTRWIPDARNSFQNRLMWSVREPEEVNHEPVAIINGGYGNAVINLHLKAGKTITLDASGSFDPDNDVLSYRWYRYAEADNYKGDFLTNGSSDAVLTIEIPGDIADENIHLVLEVRDDGQPSLVKYRRVIIHGA